MADTRLVISSDDAELVRRAFEAWNEGGVDAIQHLFDDLVEWHDIPEVPWTAVYRGKAAVVGYLREFESSGVMALRFDVVELRCVGDEIFVVAKVEATGSGSGIVSGSQFIYLWRVRDRKIVRVRVFLDREHAIAVTNPEDA